MTFVVWHSCLSDVQLFPALEMPIVIDQILPSLTPCAWIETGVLSRLRGVG